MKRNTGFTLVELLMVIIIIGVLVTLALPKYMHAVERARCTKAMHTLQAYRQAIIAYFREFNTFREDPNNSSSAFVTEADLESFVNTSLASTAEWQYAITFPSDSQFNITATRLTSTHSGQNIVLDETGHWTGTYPFNDPASL